MPVESFIRKAHRIFAILFLLTIPPAAYFSFTGDPDSPSPVVYLPLFPLLFLMLGGTFLLVAPWVRKLRARRTS